MSINGSWDTNQGNGMILFILQYFLLAKETNGKYNYHIVKNKLEEIFDFLNQNRQYNHALQNRVYISFVSPYNNSKDKIISLLYQIANTQSQPNIDKLAEFYKSINADTDCRDSLTNFITRINPKQTGGISYDSLYTGMKNQSGWGEKTAALFTKCIFHLHNDNYDQSLKIWDDVPKKIDNEDTFYLPVDAVIISIFKRLDKSAKWNFNNINSLLKTKYKGQQIEVWDDLWFWGFITQNGSGDNREFQWNENKYWALKESDKAPLVIAEIKEKANEFLKIIVN